MNRVTDFQALQKVKEIKEIYEIQELEQYLKQGWILLNEVSAQGSGRYSIGRIQDDADQRHNLPRYEGIPAHSLKFQP